MTLSGGGGVRPTTVLCDWAATTGAELHDRAWLTERGLEGALMLHTKAIVANPTSFSLPGCVSGKGAVLPQRRDAGREREGPMRAFLTAAGAVV